MDDRKQPDETAPDPAEDREPQGEQRERADTVDGVLSPGSTADGAPTGMGEDD